MNFFDPEFLTAWFTIIVIDIVLSGDNAVVIALAAHRLPPKQRRLALWFGMAAAIGLRIVFTALVSSLLGFPYLRLVGGLLLIWIAVKLLVEEEEATHQVRTAVTLFGAVWTITLADCVMSLDNMLAVGGASEGNWWLLIFGLVVSIFIIMRCSGLIAGWMNRLPILVTVGAGVLALTAGQMILKDHEVARFLIDRGWGCYCGGLHKEFDQFLDPATIESIQHSDWLGNHWIGWLFNALVLGLVLVSPYVWRLTAEKEEVLLDDNAPADHEISPAAEAPAVDSKEV